LDRVLHGISGEQVLYACDENTTISSSVDSGLANPAVHFFRGLRHRNISAIKHATQVKYFYLFHIIPCSYCAHLQIVYYFIIKYNKMWFILYSNYFYFLL